MESADVSAVLFVKDLKRVAAFYTQALGMPCAASDAYHAVLDCRGFRLTVHQIPEAFASEITIQQPPERREDGPIRLNFPVNDIQVARSLAEQLGGFIDPSPPDWAGPQANIFLGHDPEGNVFMLSEHPC